MIRRKRLYEDEESEFDDSEPVKDYPGLTWGDIRRLNKELEATGGEIEIGYLEEIIGLMDKALPSFDASSVKDHLPDEEEETAEEAYNNAEEEYGENSFYGKGKLYLEDCLGEYLSSTDPATQYLIDSTNINYESISYWRFNVVSRYRGNRWNPPDIELDDGEVVDGEGGGTLYLEPISLYW